jgi:hypothetical protein
VPSEDYRRGYRDGFLDARDHPSQGLPRAVQTTDEKRVSGKKKRKASAYNLEYKKQYAKLKKKHPRSSFSVLAKKAHKATRRARK